MRETRASVMRRANLNSEIKACGAHAKHAGSPKEKAAEIARMNLLFSTILTENLADEYAYCAMIHALGQAGEIVYALNLYHQTQYKNCFIHAAILQALRANNQFSTIFNLYFELIQSNVQTNSHIFSIVMLAAKEKNELVFAHRVYQDAVQRGQVNNFVGLIYRSIASAAAASSIQPTRNERGLPASVNPNAALVRAFYYDHPFFNFNVQSISVPAPKSGSVRPL